MAKIFALGAKDYGFNSYCLDFFVMFDFLGSFISYLKSSKVYYLKTWHLLFLRILLKKFSIFKIIMKKKQKQYFIIGSYNGKTKFFLSLGQCARKQKTKKMSKSAKDFFIKKAINFIEIFLKKNAGFLLISLYIKGFFNFFIRKILIFLSKYKKNSEFKDKPGCFFFFKIFFTSFNIHGFLRKKKPKRV